MENQLDKLLAQQGRATQKKHEAEQQEKRLKKQISDLKNKERIGTALSTNAFNKCSNLTAYIPNDPEIISVIQTIGVIAPPIKT